jgi:hypothetical protein
MAEIKLCKKLAEKRTDRASLLTAVAATRPPTVLLVQLQISERRKRAGTKEKSALHPEELLILRGFCGDSRGITAWMERLLSSGAFSSVNLVSMEKKDGLYRFQVGCDLPGSR